MSIKLIFSVVSHFFFGVFATLGDMRVQFMVDLWNLRDFVKSFFVCFLAVTFSTG